MTYHTLYFDIVAGRAAGWWWPVRCLLSTMSVGYGAAVRRRNRRFDSAVEPIRRLQVPVISVGNITTGGTGKTPLVIDLLERLLVRGFRPAVVSRGYKSRGAHLGDELRMIHERLPDVVAIADPDRFAGGRAAVERGADMVVLDDGFQHRSLDRDLDIVVIDATNPFGFDHLLPRGTLREPLLGLSRADLVVVSRADLVTNEVLEAIDDRLREFSPGVPLVRCHHQPCGLFDLGGVRDESRFHRPVLFAAIGNPGAFEKTVQSMDMDPVKTLWWPDHHAYDVRDIARLVGTARDAEADVFVTTHKDAVKLGGLDLEGISPLRYVDITLAFSGADSAVVDRRLDEVVGGMGHRSSTEGCERHEN